MKQENLDLAKLFTDNLCTFEMAKKAAAAGMTCANTFFAYNEKGDMTDGAWLQKVTGGIFYPAISLNMAIFMLEEDCDLPIKKLVCYRYNNKYFLKEGDKLIAQQENLVDLFVATWIKYKKPDTGPLPPIDPTVHDGPPPTPISSEPVN